MTDLLALVITVQPQESASVPGHLGRAVHAQLLRWLDAADSSLAQHWHDTDGPKPYTCSTLVGARRNTPNVRQIQPDRTYWFRLTAFDPAVVAVLEKLLADPPAAAELENVSLPVVGITADPEKHPWAGQTMFEEIAAPYLLARQQSPRRLKLQFASPTGFRHNDMTMAVPLPSLVFGGLADRWNAFSPIGVSPEVRAYSDASVAMTNYRLHSQAIPQKAGAAQIGAVGEAGYVAVRYDRYWMAVLGLLADFAFYGGVGRGTTTGLGQVRRLE
ncbi:CRISPR system precrRNA processing endoribonuclease RAMP protein Cas6 [Chloroflexota bacterium]